MHFQVEASEAFILAYTTCWCLFFWVTTSGFKHSLVFVITNTSSTFVYLWMSVNDSRCQWENYVLKKWMIWWNWKYVRNELRMTLKNWSISDKWTSIILVKSCQNENNNLWMHTCILQFFWSNGPIPCGFQPNGSVDPRSDIVSMLNHIFWDKWASHKMQVSL